MWFKVLRVDNNSCSYLRADNVKVFNSLDILVFSVDRRLSRERVISIMTIEELLSDRSDSSAERFQAPVVVWSGGRDLAYSMISFLIDAQILFNDKNRS